MRKCLASTLALLLAASVAVGGDLSVSEVLEVPGEPTPVFLGPFRCDLEGNLFFLPAKSDGSLPDTIVGVEATGRRSVRYSIGLVPGLGNIGDSALVSPVVAPGGDLFALGFGGGAAFIVEFGKDGRHRSKSSLEGHGVEYVPKQVSVFSSGRFLLFGSRISDGLPVTLVMSSQGRRLAEVRFPRSTDRRRPTADPRTVPPDLMLVDSGPGDLIYVTAPTPKGPVYVVDSTGEVVRHFDTISPARDATPISLKVSRRRLAIEYQGPSNASGTPPKRWIVTYDLSTGKRERVYRSITDPLVCFMSEEPDKFTLLGAPGPAGELRLVQAVGR